MDQEQRAEVAAQVRQGREMRGWSQRRLAEEAGVAENTVTKLEKGERATQPGKLRAILDALGIEPTGTVIDLEGVPEDVKIFLTVAAQRLRVLDEADRQRVLNDLYPRLLTGR